MSAGVNYKFRFTKTEMVQIARQHWATYLPRKYRALKDSGTLEHELSAAAQATMTAVDNDIVAGSWSHDAWERHRETHLFLPAEQPWRLWAFRSGYMDALTARFSVGGRPLSKEGADKRAAFVARCMEAGCYPPSGFCWRDYPLGDVKWPPVVERRMGLRERFAHWLDRLVA